MSTSQKKKILLGISGSIAAYKSAALIRLFIKDGHEVRCIMTPSAAQFISPLTISTLCRHKVYIDFFEDDTWSNHVELGLWADVFIIAPLSASSLGKMANGISDNMLIATYLSSKCPVLVAPAMDLDMWAHPSTKQNLEKITAYGNTIIPVGNGELASGLYGEGRMAEPEEILSFVYAHFNVKKDLEGKNVLITAGPTYEHLDPVRFIGNHSSGKMGIAIAEEAALRGANVTLVLGPTNQMPVNDKIHTIKVTSAQSMYESCKKLFSSQHFIIWAAAVADYRPKEVSSEKIKKSDETLNLILEKNIDIAATLGKEKNQNQKIVGFALETNNEIENAIQKIHKKNFDFIVLNSLNDKGAGFGGDTNKITIIHKDARKVEFALKSKKEVAIDIINEILK